MKNTYPVFYGSQEFTCIQFSEVDPSRYGIDIHNAETGYYVGQIMDISIPEMDDPDYDEQCTKFEYGVVDFIIINGG